MRQSFHVALSKISSGIVPEVKLARRLLWYFFYTIAHLLAIRTEKDHDHCFLGQMTIQRHAATRAQRRRLTNALNFPIFKHDERENCL